MDASHPTHMLTVDLSDRSTGRETIPPEWLTRYVGGKGLGARYLYRELDAGVDPLGPDNVLLLVTGPITGLTPGEPRYAAITKSPLTGAFLDSYSGGEFAARLAGGLGDAMGLIVRGSAETPVTLHIENGSVRIEPALGEWGRSVDEIAERYSNGSVASIGPAGERQVVFATIATDGGDHHAGRGGAGAVMGSKSLKAVVVEDEPPGGLEFLRDAYERAFLDDDRGKWVRSSETAETIDFANEVGFLPSNGWQTRGFDGTDAIGIEAVLENASERERAESAIPGGFRLPADGGDVTARGAMQMTLGAGLGIDSIEDVAALGKLCDRLGIDVIGVGNAVAWAVRAGEMGLVDYDGSFGDSDAARELITAIATRSTPLGDVLANGLDAAVDRYGGRSLIPTVKGMSLPSYDPGRLPSMALAYATSDRGACHRRARPFETAVFRPTSGHPADQIRDVIEDQDVSSIRWSLIVDDFVGFVFEEDYGAEWLRAVGYDLTAEELRVAGERIWNLTRLFNIREGLDRTADVVPSTLRESGDSTADVGNAVEHPPFGELLEDYYARRGWDERGIPTSETLERLGLADLECDGSEELTG